MWVNRGLKQEEGGKESVSCEVGIKFEGGVVVLHGSNSCNLWDSQSGWIAGRYKVGDEIVFEEVRP
jgi:hypothetical protein